MKAWILVFSFWFVQEDNATRVDFYPAKYKTYIQCQEALKKLTEKNDDFSATFGGCLSVEREENVEGGYPQ